MSAYKIIEIPIGSTIPSIGKNEKRPDGVEKNLLSENWTAVCSFTI